MHRAGGQLTPGRPAPHVRHVTSPNTRAVTATCVVGFIQLVGGGRAPRTGTARGGAGGPPSPPHAPPRPPPTTRIPQHPARTLINPNPAPTTRRGRVGGWCQGRAARLPRRPAPAPLIAPPGHPPHRPRTTGERRQGRGGTLRCPCQRARETPGGLPGRHDGPPATGIPQHLNNILDNRHGAHRGAEQRHGGSGPPPPSRPRPSACHPSAHRARVRRGLSSVRGTSGRAWVGGGCHGVLGGRARQSDLNKRHGASGGPSDIPPVYNKKVGVVRPSCTPVIVEVVRAD